MIQSKTSNAKRMNGMVIIQMISHNNTEVNCTNRVDDLSERHNQHKGINHRHPSECQL